MRETKAMICPVLIVLRAETVVLVCGPSSAIIRAMRTAIAMTAACLLLASCGGGDPAAVSCESTYWDGEVGTCLPAGWRVVNRSQLDERGVPAEVVVAFQSATPFSGQFATVTATREALGQAMTTEEYSAASIVSVQALPGYTEVDKRAMMLDDAEIDLHIFTAQPRDDQPASRFYQVSAISPDGAGYTFTGATPVSTPEELEGQVTAILRGVTFEGEGETASADDAVEEEGSL